MMTTPITVILIVMMNSASLQPIAEAGFTSMAACEAKRPAATAIYRAEWSSAELFCVKLPYYAPETSPRPKPRPVSEEDVLRALRGMLWNLKGELL